MKQITPRLAMIVFGCAGATTLLSSSAIAQSFRAYRFGIDAQISQAWLQAGQSNSLFAATGVASHGGPMYLATKSQSYLGISMRDVSQDEVGPLKLKEARGAEIVTVDHDGPAGKVGLSEHDVVLQMNGQPIEGGEQLRRMLRETPAGRTITLLVSRSGQLQTVNVQLANRADVERQAWEQHFSVPDPESQPAAAAADSALPATGAAQAPMAARPGFVSGGPVASAEPTAHSLNFLPLLSFRSAYTGAMLDSLGPQLASFFGARPGTGLLIKSVDANSPASSAGLKAGDVVVKVNSVEVTQPNDWLHAMREHKGQPVQVTVLRDKREETLSLTPGAPKKK